MRLAYVDCFSGASGDMLLGACLDCGVPLKELRQALAGLPLTGYDLRSEQVRRGGLRATKVYVDLAGKEQPDRRLGDILTLIDKGTLSQRVKDKSRRVFQALAEAEAAVHGTTVESVHFHEVGAVDSIVDVVGTVAALERLGVARLECSPLTEGRGWVETAHGRLPVPVPATAQLIRGVPVHQVEAEGELLTPTGAALLATLAGRFGPFPEMRVESVGYGAGSRELAGQPNVLRLFVGETEEAWLADEVVVLETNLDDTTGETIGHLSGLLLEEGALDVFLIPIQMKKQRPGVLLSVLAPPEKARPLEQIIFRHTGTFGIRWRRASRHVLAREHKVVETEFGPVRIKVGRLGSDVVVRAPEYEDCARLAQSKAVPLRSVYESAQAAARKLGGGGASPSSEEGSA
jgi:uncharacterized protein (TIGR00299 family) protein